MGKWDFDVGSIEDVVVVRVQRGAGGVAWLGGLSKKASRTSAANPVTTDLLAVVRALTLCGRSGQDTARARHTGGGWELMGDGRR